MMLITKWFGTFLWSEGEITEYQLFPKDAEKIADHLNRIENGDLLEEEHSLVEGIDNFSVIEKRLIKLGGELTEGEPPEINPNEFDVPRELLHDAMLILSKGKIKEAITPDDHIIQAINAVDEILHTSNVLSERLHEWHGLHFPDFNEDVLVEDMPSLVLNAMKEEETKHSEDKEAIIDLAVTIQKLQSTKKVLEEGINRQMESYAKNVSYLIGPLIGARLLAKAGSLERLSYLPSGTIQLLGAEKALFRHLKEGSKPPKHGVIFQHPLVHKAPYWQRGRIARAFAAKVAIAAKMDYNSDVFLGEELKTTFLKRVEEIRKKHPEPPKRKPRRR